MRTLQAFHGEASVKRKYLTRVRKHMKLDNLIRGVGWDNGKGCAIGCTLEKYDHKSYETELGIPEWLARVEDKLFEGMSKTKSKTWPEKFLSAIKVGAKLESIKSQFLIIILEHSLLSISEVEYDKEKFTQVNSAIDRCKSAVQQIIDAQKSGNKTKIKAALVAEAEEAADAASRVGYSTADGAAARAAEVADAAGYAASGAARVNAAGYAMVYAAIAAGRAAAAVAEVREPRLLVEYASAYKAAYAAAHDYFAAELLKLLKKAK